MSETFEPEPFREGYVHEMDKLPEAELEKLREMGMDPSYRKWGQIRTNVGPFKVSTVQLITDHGFGLTGPLWFETMAWHAENDGWLDIQERYATGEEAKLGHARVVADLRASLARDENPT